MKNLNEQIQKLEKELQELKNEINKPEEKWQDKLVQPNKMDFYKLESNSAGLFPVLAPWRSHRKPEHAFRTFEQADLVKEKMLLMQEMLAFAHVRNDGWDFDWTDGHTIKFGLVLIDDSVFVDKALMENNFVFGIAVKSERIAEEMFDIFGDRIEKYYCEQY